MGRKKVNPYDKKRIKFEADEIYIDWFDGKTIREIIDRFTKINTNYLNRFKIKVKYDYYTPKHGKFVVSGYRLENDKEHKQRVERYERSLKKEEDKIKNIERKRYERYKKLKESVDLTILKEYVELKEGFKDYNINNKLFEEFLILQKEFENE